MEVPEPQLNAWRSLLDAQATVVARAERALADAGLPPLSWYDVLWELFRAPERRLRMHELAERVTISRSGLVRFVDRLERAGAVTREACPTDRRGAYAVLTEAGAELLRKMWPVYAQTLNEAFASRLDDAEAEQVVAALGRVTG
jgi:DNA-binding MarR family transcriptional regulator